MLFRSRLSLTEKQGSVMIFPAPSSPFTGLLFPPPPSPTETNTASVVAIFSALWNPSCGDTSHPPFLGRSRDLFWLLPLCQKWPVLLQNLQQNAVPTGACRGPVTPGPGLSDVCLQSLKGQSPPFPDALAVAELTALGSDRPHRSPGRLVSAHVSSSSES